MIILQHLFIHFSLHFLPSGRFREVKNKAGKFQTFSSNSGRGRLPEVVPYKRFQIQWFDLETFGILENCSLSGRGGRLREVAATRGSSVVIYDNTV